MWIELKEIHKHYGKVRANNGVSFTVQSGSIHAIIGENGAGKSTLMKILSGYNHKTSGTILIDNEEVEFKNPAHASKIGIGMLYQEPMDFPQLSVLENFMIGQSRGFTSKRNYFKKKLAQYTNSLSFDLDPDTIVKSLTVGERQQLEIIRLLSMGIKVLILDEPTTGISTLQKEVLFSALKKLAEEGKSVILVSHKLEDVDALCDRITVLRQGSVTGGMEKPFDTEKILQMMFDTLPENPGRKGLKPGAEALVMENVSISGGRTGLYNCNVVIRKNEVVGLAGLEGSGQGLFLRCATGLVKPYKGSVKIFGKELARRDHTFFQKEGMAGWGIRKGID